MSVPIAQRCLKGKIVVNVTTVVIQAIIAKGVPRDPQ